MKTLLLHILFWICYSLLYLYMSFLWDKATFPAWPTEQLLKVSVSASLLDLIPQIVFSYYLMYYGVNNIVRRQGILVINIFAIVVVYLLCILAARYITNYIEIPFFYRTADLLAPILDIQRVFTSMVNIGFASGLIFSIKSVVSLLDAKEREKNLIKEKLETELIFLRNQTNPHFLFNTLNNIYALARKKSDETAEVVMKLSKLLRFMLYESKNAQIKIMEEIKVLDDYIDLEKIRYDGRLTIHFTRNIDDEYNEIAPLLLISFVENAFKHGASESRFESFIFLNIKLKNKILHFSIENTKEPGFKSADTYNIGMTNVRRQLELLYNDYEVSVQNEEALYKVKLRINLASYAKI